MAEKFQDAVTAAKSSRASMKLVAGALRPLVDGPTAHAIALFALEESPFDVQLDDPVARSEFIRGPLADAVEAVVGPAEVDAICNHAERYPWPRASPRFMDEESGVVPVAPRYGETLPTGPRPVVMLVTASEELRDHLEAWLVEAGYALSVCGEPDAVVAQCTAVDPALVIFDDGMPHLRRAQSVGLLHHTLRRKTPPLLAIGGRIAGGADGLVASLRLPIERSELIATVNRHARSGTEGVPPPVAEDTRLAFLLDEALEKVVASSVRQAVIAAALGGAQLEGVPGQPGPFDRFVRGPLRETLADAVGSDAADAVLLDLEPHLERQSDPPRKAAILPRAELRGAARPSAPAARRRGSDTVERPRRLRLLLVDDDERVRHTMANALIQRGFDVEVAADGDAALEACQRYAPDVIIADLHMPRLSGGQLCALVQLSLGDEAPPVVVVTGDARASQDIPGAASVLFKPVSPARLAEEAHRLVGAS
ncbi:MAG: response regulator [Polyangiaceae bacterium]